MNSHQESFRVAVVIDTCSELFYQIVTPQLKNPLKKLFLIISLADKKRLHLGNKEIFFIFCTKLSIDGRIQNL